MSDYTHLPIPEGYRLVRRGYPKSGETYVFGHNTYTAAMDFKQDTHNIVEKIPAEKKPMMEIPKGWRFVAHRIPNKDEWYMDRIHRRPYKTTHNWVDSSSCTPAWQRDIVEPIIPSGWEFVDYRVAEPGESYVWTWEGWEDTASVHEKLNNRSTQNLVIVKKEEEKKPMMNKLNLESYSYTPKMNPITPRDIYGSHLEKIPAVLGDKWEVVDFRPVECGDYYIDSNLFYELTAYKPSYATSTITKPRFIVKKLREITDTERMDWLCGDKHSGAYMPTSKNGAQRITRDLVDNEIRENEKKGN